MFGDPIFLLSLLAVFGLIGIWIYQVLQDALTDQSGIAEASIEPSSQERRARRLFQAQHPPAVQLEMHRQSKEDPSP